MTGKQFEELPVNWTIRKTNKKVLNLPIDQIHEQENCKIKGKGGINGLTENPSSLQNWMICGAEILRIVAKFEVFQLRNKTNNYSHHDKGSTYQGKIHKTIFASYSNYRTLWRSFLLLF